MGLDREQESVDASRGALDHDKKGKPINANTNSGAYALAA